MRSESIAKSTGTTSAIGYCDFHMRRLMGGAIHPGGSRLVDIQTAVVQIRRKLHGMRERVGSVGLVKARLGAQEQCGRARTERGTEGSAGGAAVGSARKRADDVFTRSSNPHVGAAVIGERRTRIIVRGGGNSRHLAIEG